MADFLASALNGAQVALTPNFNAPELRELQNPILRVGMQNRALITNVSDIRQSTKRSATAYLRNKMTTTSGTSRSHNFTGSQGDSTAQALSWSTYSETFAVYHSAGDDNIFNTQMQFMNGFEQRMRAIRERIGTAFVSTLHAGRTQTSNATVLNASFNSTNYAFEITDSEEVFAKIQSVMAQHKYYNSLDVIVDSILDVKARKIAAQGAANGTNLQYSLQGLNIMPHNVLGTDVAVSAYPTGGVAIAMPAQSYAVIPWVPAKYRAGEPVDAINSVNGRKFVMVDNTGLTDANGMPLEYAVWAYTIKADGSSNGGVVDDRVTYVQMSVDVATPIADITASSETPVYEFALVG